MKKTIAYITLSLVLCSTGVTLTSCDSEAVSAILEALLNTGNSYTYSGSGTAQSLVKDASNNFQEDGTAEIKGQCTVTVNGNGTTANLVLPAVTCGNFQMSQVTFSALTLSLKDNMNYLETGNNTRAEGTLTYNGQTYEISNLYIVCKLNDAQITISEMSIYFGDDQYALNLKLTGEIVTQ